MHQFFHASLPVRNNNSNSYRNKVSFPSFVSANIEISFQNSKWLEKNSAIPHGAQERKKKQLRKW